MFIRAARDLSAGDELFWSYIDAATSWAEYRKDRCNACWQFCCTCKRCKLEEQYQDGLKHIHYVERDISTYSEVVIQVEEALQRLSSKGLPHSDKELLRAGFLSIYAFCNFEQFRHVKGFPTPLQILALMHQVVPGMEDTLTMMAALCKRIQSVLLEGGMRLLRDEVLALYGPQDPKVVDSVIAAARKAGMPTAKRT